MRRRMPADGKGGRPAQRLSGRDRGLLYAFLAGTGLRVGEIGQLTAADVRLDAVPPFIQIPAAVTKSRKDQTVPLRSDLVAMLRDRLAGLLLTDPIFAIPQGLIARFHVDCRRVGIPRRNGDGRQADLHSLRTTIGTLLSRSGVTPRVTMELMRHSRIDLTMKVYTDPRLLPSAAAVESLPALNASTTAHVVAKVVPTRDARGHPPASDVTKSDEAGPTPVVA